MAEIVAAMLLSYLLGSVPSSIWMGRIFRGIDLRDHGSGNAGATNAFRVLGKPIGIAVLILDMGKGFLAVQTVGLQDIFEPESSGWILLSIVLGLLAVTGHIFPLFARFRGGKGVATVVGAGLALHPWAALTAIGVYLVVFLFTRLSALGSLIAALSYPVWMILVYRSESTVLHLFSVAVPLLIIITHRSNIRRLIERESGSNRKSGS
mgnify:FL=1